MNENAFPDVGPSKNTIDVDKNFEGEFEISTEYQSYNSKTNKTENIQINIDLNKKLSEYIDFYKMNSIDISPDFEKSIKDIWEEYKEEIKKSIEEKGFNEVLIIPKNISLEDLKDKMVIGYSYYGEIFDANKEDFNKQNFESEGMDRPHLVLVHKVENLNDHPELSKTLKTKGEDLDLNKALNIEEYLIFQRKYLSETGYDHLDNSNHIWLATKLNNQLLTACWMPVTGKLSVDKESPSKQFDYLGYRLCEKFFKKSL